MTAEEAFGYYFIAGYTGSGVPYGITMAEAEEQGLLKKNQSKADDDDDDDIDLPF